MPKATPIQKALISVYNKDGLEPLAKTLKEAGVQIYSTGGTATFLKEKCGVDCIMVESVTGFPELMEGRVKTLHPKVFGGILARRETSNDVSEANTHEIPLFDLVVVNLYPFWEYVGATRKEQAAHIDIGGPSLLRASSKNCESVTVLSDPGDYHAFIDEFEDGSVDWEFRKAQAAKTFQRTSQYDAAIAETWNTNKTPSALSFSDATPLRYGENPHQQALYCGKPSWNKLQGKELSYNNLLDTDAAVRITQEFTEPTVAIIKHNNPCGVGQDGTLASAFDKALKGDPVSAFGGIVSANTTIDADSALKMSELFLEVVVAPSFSEEAKEIFSKKKNLRLIEWESAKLAPWEVRAALGGWLLQETDATDASETTWRTVTQTKPSPGVLDDLKFCWKVAKHVRSNAIVLAKDLSTLGVGAGQMSRVDAVNLSLEKAKERDVNGAVLASDAFFPFRDNIDLLKGTGIKAIVQPGGSKRDEEVIAACNEHGIAMVFTAMRHFRH